MFQIFIAGETMLEAESIVFFLVPIYDYWKMSFHSSQLTCKPLVTAMRCWHVLLFPSIVT